MLEIEPTTRPDKVRLRGGTKEILPKLLRILAIRRRFRGSNAGAVDKDAQTLLSRFYFLREFSGSLAEYNI
jgi:hypothetical protein